MRLYIHLNITIIYQSIKICNPMKAQYYNAGRLQYFLVSVSLLTRWRWTMVAEIGRSWALHDGG